MSDDDKKQYVLGEDCGSTEETVKGWVSRKRHFYGLDKVAADYDGATCRRCNKCGKLTRSRDHITCDSCRDVGVEEDYAARAPQQWNGTDPLYSEKADKWIFSEDDLIELWMNEDPKANPDVSLGQMFLDLQVIICIRKPCVELAPDINDIEADANLEDGVKFPNEVYDAFKALKKALSEINEPAYWEVSKFRAIE